MALQGFIHLAILHRATPLPEMGSSASQIRRSFACFCSNTNSSSSAMAGELLLERLPVENTKQDTFRPLANFPPDIWGNYFASLPLNELELESYSRKVELLKEKVREKLLTKASPSNADEMLDKIELFYLLYRLGLSYHFETEIEQQLNHFFHPLTDSLTHENDYGLHTVALAFQVLRQNGYKMPCDVFNKFVDDKGMFKETLATDAKGMLSLYEASQFGIQGEDILDEALSFTTAHLQSLATDQTSPPHLAEYITNALKWPYHKGVPRVEARQYISFYEHVQHSSRNDTLLELAKYDFNRVQLLHQQELTQIWSWWKNLGLVSKLNIRDRIVEVFFWSVGMYFEPHYARARKIFTQLLQMLGAVDDIYDGYGTYEELRQLTIAILRWDISAVDELPTEYLKLLYKALLDVHDEAEREVAQEGRSFSVSYTKEEMKKTVKTYLIQARWTCESYVPNTLDEYLDTALYSSADIITLAESFIGMPEAGVEAFEWLTHGESKSVKAGNAIARLYDDIVTEEDEENRGHPASALKCYMNEHGVSREETVIEFRKRLANAWKDLNEDFMRPTAVPMQILLRVLNLQRLTDLTYKDADGFTYAEQVFKDHIYNVLVHPIPI